MSDDARRQLQRLVMRCITTLLLDEMGRLMRRHDGAFGRAILFLALCQATRAEAASVRIRTIAQSLGIPYETARRHAHELVGQGLCVGDGEAGFNVPEAVLEAEGATSRESLDRVLAMIATLKGLGVDLDQFERAADGAPLVPSAPGSAPALGGAIQAGRWTRNVIDAYILRLLEFGIPAHGQALDAALAVALIDLNTGGIATDPTLAWRYAGADAPPPEALMQPATVIQIAARISLPYETARRRVERLAKLGRFRKVKGGYVADRAFLDSPLVMQTGLLCVQRTAQLVQQLRAGGLDLDTIPARTLAAVA